MTFFLLEALGVTFFAAVLVPRVAEAAVVVIDSTTNTSTNANLNTGAQTVFVSDTVGYAFYRDSNGQCVYRKTTDSGDSWSSTVVVHSQSDCVRLAVWYDQWTPGDTTGSSIHIISMETSPDELFYNRLDTADDTLLLGSLPVSVSSNLSQTPSFSISTNTLTLTKATDGEVYAATSDGGGSFVVSCSSNCQLTTSWNEVGSNPLDNSNDHNILMPLVNGHVLLINRDITANTIRSRVWDKVSWSSRWTVINNPAVESVAYDGGMSATVDLNNNNIYLAFTTDNNSLIDDNDDIRTAVYDGSAWTSMTDVLTNVVGRGVVDTSIAIDQNTSDVYVAYTIQDTGGDSSTGNIYYRQSTNGMATWGAEVGPINSTAGNILKPALDPSNYERLYVTWWESSTDDRYGETLANIGPDTTIGAIGAMVSTVEASTTANYLGGAFVVDSILTNTVSSLTITETGSIDASTGLDNISLYYDTDTSAPYDCADQTYDGNEPQFGNTVSDGFNAADGEVEIDGAAVVIGPTVTLCLYVIADVTSLAFDGEEISLQVADPMSDLGVTGSAPFPINSVVLSGSTTIVASDLTQTGYHWRADDGTELTATSLTGSANTPVTSHTKYTPARLRLGVAVTGSTSTTPVSYQLEYATLANSCALATGWVAVDAADDAFAMFDSTFIADGADTTNINLATGGVPDVETNFVTTNGGVQDIGDTTSSLTLATDEFVELEYSIVATSSAAEGITYCFRVTDNGTPLSVYDQYPEITIQSDITVSATGTQRATVEPNNTDVEMGGVFVFTGNTGTYNISRLTITETGSIDASTGLDNISLYYDTDTSAPYDCADQTYDGNEPQFGNTVSDGFSAADGEVVLNDTSASVTVSPTRAVCMYTVLDVTNSANNNETIRLSISSPSTEVVAGSASVAPSSPVFLTGTTTVLRAVLTQNHYHWRQNDGTETDASSYTNGVEDTAVSDFNRNNEIRLRLSLANEGATSTTALSYQLQSATKVSTCNLATDWSTISSNTDNEWALLDSDFLSDGDNTTNIANAIGGVSDENTQFVGSGGVLDTSSSTVALVLSEDDFYELEFSLTSTNATEYQTTYCFRLVSSVDTLEDYALYPEITTASKRDFRIQRGQATITGTSVTINAGTDYTAPEAANRAFIRITNTHHTGAGNTTGGGSQDVEEVTAYISNPENLANSITFTRNRALNDTYIDWEIIEFIGRSNTDNEIIVRGADTVTLNSNQTNVTGSALTGVEDDADVVVFITGVRGNDTGNDFYATQVTSDWLSATKQPTLTREATGNSVTLVSYAVVEFVGENWHIQRAEHTYTAAGTTETENIDSVTSINQTFIHAQKRVGANATVINHGHEVYLSSIGRVSFALPTGASTDITHTSVAWVIANTQTGTGAMRVERQNGSTRNGSEPLALAVAISDTLEDVSNSSIFGNSSALGSNTAHPRSVAGLRILSDSSYQLWRSDTGVDLFYRTELVQWPVADLNLRQNYYRFYVDNNLLSPTDAWPAGDADIGENTPITNDDNPPGLGDVLRLRTTVQVRNANLPANFAQFKLQFAERITTCTAVNNWSDVGLAASTTALWRGFNATGTTDGTDLSSDPPTPGDLLLSVANVAGSVEHVNDSALNPYRVFDGEDVEYDWYLQHNGAEADTVYCFRLVEADDSVLAGYLQYPQIRTADFTPNIADWRWYGDPENETPSNTLALINSAPTNIGASSTLALRVVIPETKQVSANNVKFTLQFSEDPSFTSATTLAAATGCTLADTWCYHQGGGVDNSLITTAVVGTSDSCVGGVGTGCGTHNSSVTPAAIGHTHNAGTAQEYSFTLTSTAPRPNAVYYFRLFDVNRAKPVALATDGSYPTVVGEGAGLVFSIGGLPSGTSTAGVVTTASTTATAVSFDDVNFNSDVIAAQRIGVDTNAIEGYRVWKYTLSDLTNSSGNTIPNITSTNAAPTSWSTACTNAQVGCVGYHTTDATLQNGSTRFAAVDTYAGLHSEPAEIIYSSLSANEHHDIIYRLSVSELQPAGQYETAVVYIATPVF